MKVGGWEKNRETRGNEIEMSMNIFRGFDKFKLECCRKWKAFYERACKIG